jgi:trk system potassium uptake protein
VLLNGFFPIIAQIGLNNDSGTHNKFCAFFALFRTLAPFCFYHFLTVLIAIWAYRHSKASDDVHYSKKEAYVSVASSWFLISALGSLPYMLSGDFSSLTDAWFESVSGFTTTGSSILTDIESLPKSILFWRSLTHWIGGIGIIVLVIVIMPTVGLNNYSIFSLESTVREKIHPRIRSVGYRLLFVYMILTFSEILLLLLGKMNLFESVCHAFGTVSTGGFSPKNSSLAEYSPYIQYVVTIFMILGGTNFVLHYYALSGKINNIKANDEFRFYIKCILTAGLVVTGILFFKTDRNLETAFRESMFQVVSIITCTGFATSDYLLWPELAWIIIFLLMFLGGSTGSTSGGIKMARHLIAARSIKMAMLKELHPNSIFTLHLNKKRVDNDTSNSILTFIFWYLLTFLAGTIILIITGLDGMTSSSAIATAMGGIGPGFGTIGPASNFAHLPSIAKLIISFFMILGRLELYTVIIIFSPAFWKK